MLVVEQLRKTYGDRVALDGVDLEVAEGEVVSLLGPNGAGKTTLVSIVCGLRSADSGRVAVGGVEGGGHSAEVRRQIGLAPQDLGIYPLVTVRQNLWLFGRLAGMSKTELRPAIENVARRLSLSGLLDRQAGQMSGGQQRRLHTAIAVLHRPRLLLLDEPTAGADVETRAHLIELVRDLANEGSAVLYSTHYLHEVETLAADVTILDEGRVVARGGTTELMSRLAVPVVELEFEGGVPASVAAVGPGSSGSGAPGPEGPDPGAADPDGSAVAASAAGPLVVDGERVSIPSRDPAATIATVLERVPSRSVTSMQIIRPSLESVYLALTGRRYDPATDSGEDSGEASGEASGGVDTGASSGGSGREQGRAT